jgi:CDP-paratose 2-epimerase
VNYLITGGCGFLGSNIAASLIAKGEKNVTLVDNLSRRGSEQNLAWLQRKGQLVFEEIDIRDADSIESSIIKAQPDVIIHLAGQVAMTASVCAPRADFEVNALGTINVLEVIRQKLPQCQVIYASTNKVYGDMTTLFLEEADTRYYAPDNPYGIDENTALEFRTPYGCSKGAADQYVLDYGKIYGIPTVVFRHSTIYGDRQFSTIDQGWIGWFCAQALLAKQGRGGDGFTISGDGKQVRDILYIDDAVDLYLKAASARHLTPGEVFNIGGGRENSLSLLELFASLERLANTSLQFSKGQWRKNDQKFFVANIARARERLGWTPAISKEDGIARMMQWTESL